MTAVRELRPGDKVTLPAPEGPCSAVFVAETAHPLYFGLRLVIWRLDSGEWSHDALSPRQDVGAATPSSADERAGRLRAALLGPETIR